ncbi:MAG: methyl-coenzyme M reductase-associated protein Mmp3 [Methanosarcinaceae archaeon]
MQEATETAEEIHVQINGQSVTLPEGTSIRDAIDISNAPYKDGTAIGVIRNVESRKADVIKGYTVHTSQGDLKIELYDDASDSIRRWSENFRDYGDTPVRWTDNNAVAFGPMETDVVPVRDAVDLGAYEVLFGAGGFDPKNTHLIFSLISHSSEYGASAEGPFGSVVSGRGVLNRLGRGDRILAIEPVIEWEETGEHIFITDLDTVLEADCSIFTYVDVEMDPLAPEGAEHFFALVRGGTFDIDLVSSSFIVDSSLHGEMCTYENFEPRGTGTVWVRTVGYGTGKAFIARDDRTASIMHSVVGRVSDGMELVRMAESGYSITIRTTPQQVMVLGMGFREASERLSSLGVELVRDGYVEDDAVIVQQTPNNTLDILRGKKVTAQGVPGSKLVKIQLYDDRAPKTLDFFRHAIGLQFKPVGPLPVMMIYENTYLFKAERKAEVYKEIMPENVPQEKVLAGEIGVTNQAAKRVGMVGVKTEDDPLFGPTGEKFASTNIVGRILEPEKLAGLKDGDIMYVIESQDGGQ